MHKDFYAGSDPSDSMVPPPLFATGTSQTTTAQDPRTEVQRAIFEAEVARATATGYDEAALERFIEAGRKAWADVPDAAAWVRNLRDGGLGEENEKLRGKLEAARAALREILAFAADESLWQVAKEGMEASE